LKVIHDLMLLLVSKIVENKLPFDKDACINRPRMFGWVNFPFWKFITKIYYESISTEIQYAIVNGVFISKHVNGIE